ncbi:MAG: SRPBCC domain-containing protein [Betaproteobacteria bacterium]|nr:SRPBCC domain-containing protein [Betaproteobacteria bacterium]
MSVANSLATSPPAQALTITRVVDAPLELVYAAWTDPVQIAKWFVLDGMSTRHEGIEVRPGGNWLFSLRLPDGTPVTARRNYREIVPLRRIVFYEKCEAGGSTILDGVHTVEFFEAAGKTRLTISVVLATAFDADNQQGWNGGWSQILDHLSTHLSTAGDPVSTREIATTRIYDAPRERVFSLWTDAAHLAQWWGPNGFTLTTQKMDLRVGGEWIFVMHGPDGTNYPNHIVYNEITAPERLVFSHGENLNSAPGLFHMITANFTAQGDKTHLSMQMLFRSKAERDAVAEKYGAVEGMQQTLGRLGSYLATKPS